MFGGARFYLKLRSPKILTIFTHFLNWSRFLFMLRAPFHSTWRKIYENVSFGFCPKNTPHKRPRPYPLPPPPPPPQTSSWQANMSTENASSLQLHNSWGILRIPRQIWFETDSALVNDQINSRNKILSLWKLTGNVTSTSCESVMPATIPQFRRCCSENLFFFFAS